MSHYIEVYVEYKEKNEKSWHLLTINGNTDMSCIDEDLKYDMERLKIYGNLDLECASSYMKVEEASDGLKSIFKYLESDRARTIPLSWLRAETGKIESNFITEVKSLYRALGCYMMTDPYEDTNEDPNKYDDDGNVQPSWNPLTFPVNKELLDSANLKYIGFEVAHSLSAKINMIYTMLKHLGDMDFDAPSYDIRLVLIDT